MEVISNSAWLSALVQWIVAHISNPMISSLLAVIFLLEIGVYVFQEKRGYKVWQPIALSLLLCCSAVGLLVWATVCVKGDFSLESVTAVKFTWSLILLILLKWVAAACTFFATMRSLAFLTDPTKVSMRFPMIHLIITMVTLAIAMVMGMASDKTKAMTAWVIFGLIQLVYWIVIRSKAGSWKAAITYIISYPFLFFPYIYQIIYDPMFFLLCIVVLLSRREPMVAHNGYGYMGGQWYRHMGGDRWKPCSAINVPDATRKVIESHCKH